MGYSFHCVYNIQHEIIMVYEERWIRSSDILHFSTFKFN
jgi:hypothetical protein